MRIRASVAVSLSAALLALPSIPAYAQWQQEPDRIFGLKFGEKIEAQIPKCDPMRSTGGQPMCWTADYRGKPKEVWNIGVFNGWFAPLSWLDGLSTFEGLYLDVDFEDSARFLEVLTARYGTPTETETDSLQTSGGALVKRTTYNWIGKRVEITLTDRSLRDVRRGGLVVVTRAYKEADEALKKKKLDAAKGKL